MARRLPNVPRIDVLSDEDLLWIARMALPPGSRDRVITIEDLRHALRLTVEHVDGVVDLSTVGAPDGVATLDGSGKLTPDQWPAALSSLAYGGTWNAATNTPTLEDGVGTPGTFLVVATEGTTSLDGESTWLVGDWVLFDGKAWQRISGTGIPAAAKGAPSGVAALDEDARLVDSQLPVGITPSHGTTFPLWTPPTQPPADGSPEAFADASTLGYQDVIDLYEGLRAIAPEYCTREAVGMDASGTYDWWRYDFSPPNPEKTIVVGGGIHGSERMSVLALYRFVHELVHNWTSAPALTYVRWKVRLVVLPMENPWGVENDSRQNANGVDLNRNFDYRWGSYTQLAAPGESRYKGTTYFSEVETQHIKSVLDDVTASGNVVGYLALHDRGAPADPEQFVLYLPDDALGSNRRVWTDIIAAFKEPGDESYLGWTDYPSAQNWAPNKYGIDSANPEYDVGSHGAAFDAADVTAAVRWFGNGVLQYARTQAPRVITESQPLGFTARFYTSSGATIFIPQGSAYTHLEDLTVVRDLPVAGIILVNGTIVVRSDVPTTTFIKPYVGQDAATFRAGSSDGSVGTGSEVYVSHGVNEGEATAVSFTGMIPVLPGGSVENARVRLGLWGYSTDGPVQVFRYFASYVFIPTDRTGWFETWSATGRAGSPDAMQRLFPSFPAVNE